MIFLTVFLLCNLADTFTQNYFEKASEEYFNGDLNEAIRLLTLSIENNDELASSYMLRGYANCLIGDLYSAIEDLNYSKKLDSTNYKVYYYLGRTYFLNEINTLALENLNIAISMYENDADAFDIRAAVKIRINNFEGAILDENIAIKIDPKDNTYYTNRGYAKFSQKQYENAIKDYNISLEIKPTQKGFSNRGYAYFLLKLYTKAIEDYNNAIKINDKDYQTIYLRGLVYEAIDNYDAACIDFKKSAELEYPLAISKVNNYCRR